MHRINFVCLVTFISIFTNIQSNFTITTTTSSMMTSEQISSSCDYCQTRTCRCSPNENILNCSSYLLNLSFASNCAENKIWEIVDFSSRNLESLDSTRLLSLRMSRLLLKSNLITNIADHTLDSLGEILIELDLQMNQLTNLSPTWFNSRLIQLKLLNLASNQLETFANLDGVHLPHLQELNLSCNQMEIFPNQIQQWTALIKLDLSFNKLSSIPRFAFRNLQNLQWLSLASNRYLSCMIQDSFKYLQSLTYLDLSSTNLIDLDGCLFIPLINLHRLKIERMSINCSSCWLSNAKKNSIELIGQCLNNITVQRLDSLTNEQLDHSCSKSSIDCSRDICEPGSERIYPSDQLSISTKDSNASKNHTLDIVLGILFSLIAIALIITVVVLIYRWRKGKKLFCCDFHSPNSSTMSEITHRRQHQQQIIDKNPTIIESVVTHGANMNYENHAYFNQSNANTKRKLYNPMFADSSISDISHHHYHRSSLESNDRV